MKPLRHGDHPDDRKRKQDQAGRAFSHRRSIRKGQSVMIRRGAFRRRNIRAAVSPSSDGRSTVRPVPPISQLPGVHHQCMQYRSPHNRVAAVKALNPDTSRRAMRRS
jgi:hypothetical protein